MPDATMHDCSLILTTVVSEEEAAHLAEVLLAERLAACVQWHAVTSRYQWNGAVQRATEQRLHIKTDADRREALLGRLRALHPYALPEIIVLPAAASADYAAWLAAETRLEQ